MKRLARTRQAALILGLLALVFILSVGGWVGGESKAEEVQTAWQNPTPLGISGVALAIVERPAGGYLAYWMGGEHGMAAASSTDGLNWSDEDGFSLPPLEPNQMMATNPWVFNTEDGRFRLIYEIQDQNHNRRFYSGDSADGLDFTYQGVIAATQNQTAMLIDPETIFAEDGVLRLYYSYGLEEQTQIYTATAPEDWSLALFPVNPPQGY